MFYDQYIYYEHTALIACGHWVTIYTNNSVYTLNDDLSVPTVCSVGAGKVPGMISGRKTTFLNLVLAGFMVVPGVNFVILVIIEQGIPWFDT